MGETRDRRVVILVSDRELDMIDRGAASEGVSRSEYCRACILRNRLVSGDPVAVRIFRDNVAALIAGAPEAARQAILDLVAAVKERRAKAGDPKGRAKGKKT